MLFWNHRIENWSLKPLLHLPSRRQLLTQLNILPDLLLFVLSGTWHFSGLGECSSQFFHHFSTNNLHVWHMFCNLLAYFLSYSSLFSTRYDYILGLCKLWFISIISQFYRLNSMIFDYMLIYEIIIADISFQWANE